MTKDLEISFNSPQCGWMSVGFSDAVNEFHTTTAHAPHRTALADLLNILTALLRGEVKESLLQWNRAPEEFDFRFVRNNGDLLLEIYQYPTEDRENAERELVFSHTGSIYEICREFGETFERLYADRDTDEFEFNWRQPFPYAEYEQFKTVSAEFI